MSIRLKLPLLALLLVFVPYGSHAITQDIMLADFENGIPCSEAKHRMGFRKADRFRGSVVNDGAEGTKWSALFKIPIPEKESPAKRDLFFQGKVRRMYLATSRPEFKADGPNAMSFWIKLGPESALINRDKKKVTFGIWTYHWEFGDDKVGGKSNNSLATDSMMHGYSNFGFNTRASGKWVNVVLTPSAFQQSRYYYHFYAARGTTDEIKFFPSVRQLQFHFFPKIVKEEQLQIDQLKLLYIKPVAVFERDFVKIKISHRGGDVRSPVIIKNPTARNRKYRVFISSFIGVHRNILYGAHTLTNGFAAPRKMQRVTGGNGGVGVVELVNKDGESVIDKQEEIAIAAGQSWKGELVHHIKPEMLGRPKAIRAKKYKIIAKRDTLTTSVIIWDPYDESVNAMRYLDILPSNADDGRHKAPPGFPAQKILPEGWRSGDIPVNQVGGYFVSVITLDKEK
jgi:hypothetical protein